jgi:peptidoglycan/LPS O-acetylase OafA/YrhL
MTAFLPMSRWAKIPPLRVMLIAAALAGALMLTTMTLFPESQRYFTLWMDVTTFSTIAIIMCIEGGIHVPLLTSLLNNSCLRWFGLISYSVYLFHGVFLGFNYPIFHNFIIFNSTLEIAHHSRTLDLNSNTAIRLMLSVVGGAASYYFIERRFLKLKTKFSGGRKLSSPSVNVHENLAR